MVSNAVPLLVMAVMAVSSLHTDHAILQKVNVMARGPVQMVFSSETFLMGKLKRMPDPDLLKGWPTNRTTVFFIRHGQSKWNQVFNQGRGFKRWAGIPWRLSRALVEETARILTPSSVFLDSPLSETGILQALAIRQDLEASEAAEPGFGQNEGADAKKRRELWAMLRGAGGGNVTVACSNLMRAAETALIALPDTLIDSSPSPARKLHCLTLLQEFSRNVDALSLSPAGQPPHSRPLPTDEDEEDGDGEGRAVPDPMCFECQGNTGNKPLVYNPLTRLAGFAEWAFMHSCAPSDAVVAVGHSLWFRTFFRAFLPHSSDHVAKGRKLSNAAVSCPGHVSESATTLSPLNTPSLFRPQVVAFSLERGVIGGRVLYRIDPDTVTVLRGSFAD